MNANLQTTNSTKRTVEIVVEQNSDLTVTLSTFQKVCDHLPSICGNNGKPKIRCALHSAAYREAKTLCSLLRASGCWGFSLSSVTLLMSADFRAKLKADGMEGS